MVSKDKVPFLYINGLGNGKTRLHEKAAETWWKQSGHDFIHAHVDWYDGEPFEAKLDEILTQARALLKEFGKLAIIGSSAGGSLALNTYHALKNENVVAINAHGRLRAGSYSDTSWDSLYRRAHLDTDQPSQSFYDSVWHCERTVLSNLTESDKKRILVLTQLTDMVVPIELMKIDGVKEHKSLAFGHSGGFLAHLIVDRNLLIRFTNEVVGSAD
jgi:hypothetical protein